MGEMISMDLKFRMVSLRWDEGRIGRGGVGGIMFWGKEDGGRTVLYVHI